VLERRPSADGNPDALFLSSLARGEQLTGVLRSPTFTVPAELRFHLAGHVGFPDRRVVEKNFVRLRDAQTHQILAEATPPRNDTAQGVHWDLTQHTGRSGYLEIVDGDDGASYAWLAVGRFDPPVVRLPHLAPRDVAQRQQAAASIVGQFVLRDLAPRLERLLLANHAHPAARQAAAQAIVQLQPDSRLAALAPVIGDPSIAQGTRDEICGVVASRDPEALRKTLADAIRTSPARVQQTLAQNLAGDRAGAEVLLTLVEDGHAAGRLLFPAVAERLNAVLSDEGKQKMAVLTAHLPSEDEDRRKLMKHRLAAFSQADISHQRGAALYTKHCRICHQLDGEGPLIGPQLDGIGNRGLERLIEDVLAPNRNVDVAFRSTTIVTTDGRALTGLFRRREGAVLVFANNEGKEFTLAEAEVDEQSKSAISLMPDNVARELTEPEFFDLMAFLLSQRNVPEEIEGSR
jgi:putative heme-binding domain-containing protein